MVIWWLLQHLVASVSSFCVTGVNSDSPAACSTKEQGVNSFLWTIQRQPPSYLFGTIHVPFDRVWSWIPYNTKMAFANSDTAIFELDLTNPSTLKSLADCQVLPEGESLSDLLPEELYSRLERHLDYIRTSIPGWMSQEQKRKGLWADYLFNAMTGNWRRKRPVWVLLMVNSLTESDVRSRGIPVLDLYLTQQAEREGKVTGAVERVEEQCSPLNQLELSQVVFALNQTLSQHEAWRQLETPQPCSSETLIQHYNCGNLNSLMFRRDTSQTPVLFNSSLSPGDLHLAQKIEQYFQHQLIDRRNARMADRVAGLLQQHPNTSFFFAFGAGHFLGNQTVIDRLQAAGVSVWHTAPHQNITRLHKAGRTRPRKSRKFVVSEDFPQPSDVIYGDIRYLFSKSWIPDSASKWGSKKRKNAATFNDLWVRTDQYRPRYLQQMGETSLAQEVTPAATDQPLQGRNLPSQGGISPRGSLQAILLLFVCVSFCV